MKFKITRSNVRGIAEPYLMRKPLLVRLCATFVDNLVLILRTAFVMGAILLVQDLHVLFEEAKQPVVEVVPVPTILVEVQESALSEGVRQALNCTYKDYRNAHYDECVPGPSDVYPRPQADPDDTGHVTYQSRVLYASLDDYVSPEPLAFQGP